MCPRVIPENVHPFEIHMRVFLSQGKLKWIVPEDYPIMNDCLTWALRWQEVIVDILLFSINAGNKLFHGSSCAHSAVQIILKA